MIFYNFSNFFLAILMHFEIWHPNPDFQLRFWKVPNSKPLIRRLGAGSGGWAGLVGWKPVLVGSPFRAGSGRLEPVEAVGWLVGWGPVGWFVKIWFSPVGGRLVFIFLNAGWLVRPKPVGFLTLPPMRRGSLDDALRPIQRPRGWLCPLPSIFKDFLQHRRMAIFSFCDFQ